MTTDIEHINTLDKIFMAELISGFESKGKKERLQKIVTHLEDCHCCRLDVIELSDMYIFCELMPKQYSGGLRTWEKHSEKLCLIIKAIIITTQLLPCAIALRINRLKGRSMR